MLACEAGGTLALGAGCVPDCIEGGAILAGKTGAAATAGADSGVALPCEATDALAFETTDVGAAAASGTGGGASLDGRTGATAGVGSGAVLACEATDAFAFETTDVGAAAVSGIGGGGVFDGSTGAIADAGAMFGGGSVEAWGVVAAAGGVTTAVCGLVT